MQQSWEFLIFLAIFSLFNITSGANILAFFPFSAKSHHILFKPLILGLCERGHQVTYLSPTQFQENTKNLEKVPYPDHWDKQNKKNFEFRTTTKLPMTTSVELASLYTAFYGLANDTLRMTEVLQILNSDRHYDAVITEAAFYHEWISVVAHRFNALHIVVQTFGGHVWTNEFSGLPSNPSYMYDLRFVKGSPPADLYERLYNLYTHLSLLSVHYYFVSFPLQRLVDDLVRYPGWETRPRLTMLMGDNALLLRNTHLSMGDSVPSAPHVKDVGGLNVDFDFDKKPEQMNLPKLSAYKSFMDNSTQGFVYFSMGSLIKPKLMLPSGTFEKLYSALSKVGINVLMRWNDDDEPRTPSPNIKLYNEFLPQMEILAHKNIKLFVTHGGLLSIAETINFGVPIYGLPVFGDQPMNVMRAQAQGYGLYTRIVEIDEKTIIDSVNELINNPKYKNEAVRRSELFKDRPRNPVEEAIYWTEYVLKHGKVLQPASVHLPFYQLYLLDLLAAVICALWLALTTMKFLAVKISGLFSGKRGKAGDQRKDKKNK